MAQARQQNAVGSAAQFVGDATGTAVRTTGGIIGFLGDSIRYVGSLFNLDGMAGAAVGLAAGAGIAAVAGVPGLLTGALGMGAVAAASTVACCGAAAGWIAGGEMGKNRIQKEKTHGKKIKQPGIINKEAIAGLGIGAAAQALTFIALPQIGVTGLALGVLNAGATILPVAGAFAGSKLGVSRQTKEYVAAAQQAGVNAQAAGHGVQKSQEAYVHPAQRSYKNSIDANDRDWQEAKSLFRDSSAHPGQSNFTGKVVADREAQQAAMQQHHGQAE